MVYAAVWKHTPAGGGQPIRLVCHPEGLEGVDTPDRAKDEGRNILGDLAPDLKATMMPLSVVELNEDMVTRLDECEMLELDDQIFVIVDPLDFWQSQPWWNK